MSTEEAKEYLTKTKIEEYLSELVRQLCLEKPKDPYNYILSYVNNNKLESLKKDDPAASKLSSSSSPKHDISRARRGAVSGTVMSEDESVNFKRIVIPKDFETRNRLKEAISTNFLFSHLDEDDKSQIFDAMAPCEFKDGDYIIKQGEEGNNFYIMESGSVDVYVQKGSHPPAKVSSIGKNGSFGELALIYGTPRAATIKANGDVKCWSLDRDTYRHVVMANTIRKRQMYSDFLERVPILEPLDHWERLTVADALEQATFQDGETVVKQGDRGDEFYLIIEGEAVVTQDLGNGQPPIVVGRLGRSQYFGEIALITNRPRAATVTAAGLLKCVKLDRDRFERVLGPCEELLKRNIQAYNSYISLKV